MMSPVAMYPTGDAERREGVWFFCNFMDMLQASHSVAFYSALPVRRTDEGEAPPYTMVPMYFTRPPLHDLPLQPITFTTDCRFYRLNDSITCVTCYGPESKNIHGITRASTCRARGSWLRLWLYLCGTGVAWSGLMTNDDAGSGVTQQRQNVCACVYRKAGVGGVSWCIHLISELYSGIVSIDDTIAK